MTDHQDPALAAIAASHRATKAAGAALEAYRAPFATSAFKEAEEAFAEANTAAFFARDAAFKAEPTTTAGAVALLRLVETNIAELAHDPDHQPTLAAAIRAAADAIEKEAAR